MTQLTIPNEPRPSKEWLLDPDLSPTDMVTEMVAIAFQLVVDETVDVQLKALHKNDEDPVDKLVIEYERAEIRNALIKEANKDQFVLERLLAQAADKAFVSSLFLEEKQQPVQTHLVLYLKENGLLQYLEMDSIVDFLNTRKSPWNGEGDMPGNHYEIAFLTNYLLPVLEANGYPRERILDLSMNFHKTKLALPQIKRMLAENIRLQDEIKKAITEATDEDERLALEETLQESHLLEPRLMESLTVLCDEMGKSAEEGLSRRQFAKRLKEIEGRNKQVTKALGYKYLLGTGGVITISVPDPKLLNAIEASLSALVDMHLGTPEDMVNEVVALLLKKKDPKINLIFPDSEKN